MDPNSIIAHRLHSLYEIAEEREDLEVWRDSLVPGATVTTEQLGPLIHAMETVMNHRVSDAHADISHLEWAHGIERPVLRREGRWQRFVRWLLGRLPGGAGR